LVNQLPDYRSRLEILANQLPSLRILVLANNQ